MRLLAWAFIIGHMIGLGVIQPDHFYMTDRGEAACNEVRDTVIPLLDGNQVAGPCVDTAKVFINVPVGVRR